MRPTTDPKRNLLLAALTDEEWERCLSSFDCVSLRQGEVLYEGGAPQHHVFFPSTAVVSLMYVTREGASAEIAIIGNEGLVGLPLLLGGLSRPSNGMVLSAGDANRIQRGRSERSSIVPGR
jgi:hypothetical protein